MCWHQTTKYSALNAIGETFNEMELEPFLKNL